MIVEINKQFNKISYGNFDGGSKFVISTPGSTITSPTLTFINPNLIFIIFNLNFNIIFTLNFNLNTTFTSIIYITSNIIIIFIISIITFTNSNLNSIFSISSISTSNIIFSYNFDGAIKFNTNTRGIIYTKSLFMIITISRIKLNLITIITPWRMYMLQTISTTIFSISFIIIIITKTRRFTILVYSSNIIIYYI